MDHAAPAKPSAARKRFDQLLGQINKQREQFAQFQLDSDAIVARWGIRVQQEKMAVQQALWEFVLALDSQLQRPSRSLAASQRKTLTEILLDLLDALAHCPDPALLDTLHQRYRGQSVAEQDQEDLEALKASFAEQFGPELLDEFQGRSIDEFIAYTRAKLETLRKEAPNSASSSSNGDGDGEYDLFGRTESARPKQKPKKTKAEQQQEAIQIDLEQSVRELFRKLLSELHPDRESDPDLRERKSEWMKRANQAYKEHDILGLWMVRAEFANQTSLPMDELSEIRLKGFCSSLAQQLDRLKMAQQKAIYEFSHRLELEPAAIPNNLLQLERLLQQRSAESLRQLKQLKHELQLFKDPHISALLIKKICADHRRRTREAERMQDFADFENFLDELVGSIEPDLKKPKRRR